MFAKVIGAVTAIIIFLLYFKWRSADLAGFWAWWATERRQRRMQDERAVTKDGEPRP